MPGSDVAGIVAAVGRAVTEYAVGDELFGELAGYRGGLADLVCTRPHLLARKPDGLSFAGASTIPQAGSIALRATADVRPGGARQTAPWRRQGTMTSSRRGSHLLAAPGSRQVPKISFTPYGVSCQCWRMAESFRNSRRYDFPPVWAVPLLFIAAIFIGMYVAMALGFLGFIAALALLWWLEPKVDAYVRKRDSAPSD